MTEIERRAVLDASIACRPACAHPDALQWPIIEFRCEIESINGLPFQEALYQLVAESITPIGLTRIPSWTFGDSLHGIQFKDDDSALYSKLSECRHGQWKSQRAEGLLVHRAIDLTLQTHYANNGDIQFKLICTPS